MAEQLAEVGEARHRATSGCTGSTSSTTATRLTVVTAKPCVPQQALSGLNVYRTLAITEVHHVARGTGDQPCFSPRRGIELIDRLIQPTRCHVGEPATPCRRPILLLNKVTPRTAHVTRLHRL